MLNAYVHPMHNVNNAQGMTDFEILYNVFILLYVYSSYKEKATSFKGCHESVCLHLFDFFHFKHLICKQKSIMQSTYL